MSDLMVKADHVRKHYGPLEVLKSVSLEVAPREVVCLIGPSGSGKSTFLRCVNHLEKINGGRLYVDGELVGYRQEDGKVYELKESEVARKRSEIGMVFQRFNLFPHMTALGNVVEAPIRVKGIRKREAREQGRELLTRVGLADKIDEYPARLSGGQQQRVAIARALVTKPTIVLADEPTGNLDSKTGGEILDLLRASADDYHQTIVMVTHEGRAASIADRILFLADGLIVKELTEATQGDVLRVMATLQS
jgi:polar amino acid transport system ATP-binding protein